MSFSLRRPVRSLCAFGDRVVLVGVLIAIAVLAGASVSNAQVIQPFTPAAFDRENGFRTTQQKPFWINREDCLNEDVLRFELKVTFPSDHNLEVWIGDADCRTKEQRIGLNGECWQVYEEPAPDDSFRIDISVLDVVARRPSTGYRPQGTLADCEVEWASSLSFYFMYVDDTDDVVGTPAIWSDTGVDMRGPLPPSDVKAGIGDEMLVAQWTQSNSIDLLGYRVYCAPRQDVTLTPDAGAEPGTGAAVLDAGGAMLDASRPAVEASVLPDGTTSASDDTAAPLDASTGALQTGDAGALTVACSAPGLIEGQLPSKDLQVCSNVTSTNASRGIARGLENGVEYALAVAAVDDLGNPGHLSNVACGIPEEVAEFYEVYRADGGGGGGGICAVSRAGALGGSRGTQTGFGWFSAALVALLGLVVRRTRQ